MIFHDNIPATRRTIQRLIRRAAGTFVMFINRVFSPFFFLLFQRYIYIRIVVGIREQEINAREIVGRIYKVCLLRQGRGSGFRKRRMGQREWKAQVEAWRVGQSYWVNSWRDLIQIFGTRNERTFRCSTSILVLRRKEGFSYLQHSYIFTRGKNFPISPKTIYTHYCIITFDLCSLQIFRICLFIRDAIRASSTSKRHKCGRTRRGRERERSFYCFTGGIKFRTVIQLDPAAITDIIFALRWNRHRIGYISYYVDKAAPLFLGRRSTRRQIKGLKRSTRHSLMNYFEWKLDWLRALNGRRGRNRVTGHDKY